MVHVNPNSVRTGTDVRKKGSDHGQKNLKKGVQQQAETNLFGVINKQGINKKNGHRLKNKKSSTPPSVSSPSVTATFKKMDTVLFKTDDTDLSLLGLNFASQSFSETIQNPVFIPETDETSADDESKSKIDKEIEKVEKLLEKETENIQSGDTEAVEKVEEAIDKAEEKIKKELTKESVQESSDDQGGPPELMKKKDLPSADLGNDVTDDETQSKIDKEIEKVEALLEKETENIQSGDTEAVEKVEEAIDKAKEKIKKELAKESVQESFDDADQGSPPGLRGGGPPGLRGKGGPPGLMKKKGEMKSEKISDDASIGVDSISEVVMSNMVETSAKTALESQTEALKEKTEISELANETKISEELEAKAAEELKAKEELEREAEEELKGKAEEELIAEIAEAEAEKLAGLVTFKDPPIIKIDLEDEESNLPPGLKRKDGETEISGISIEEPEVSPIKQAIDGVLDPATRPDAYRSPAPDSSQPAEYNENSEEIYGTGEIKGLDSVSQEIIRSTLYNNISSKRDEKLDKIDFNKNEVLEELELFKTNFGQGVTPLSTEEFDDKMAGMAKKMDQMDRNYSYEYARSLAALFMLDNKLDVNPIHAIVPRKDG